MAVEKPANHAPATTPATCLATQGARAASNTTTTVDLEGHIARLPSHPFVHGVNT